MSCYTKSLSVIIPAIIAYCIYNRDTFDPNSIRGKRVLVTGASSGIGEQVAYRYAELGAKLIITARRAELLQKVEKKCKEFGAQLVHSVPADMAKPEDRKKLVPATEKELGGLDILILNHGLIDYGWWKGTPENITLLENIMNINFISYVDIASLLLRYIRESKGNIGLVSSLAGKMGSIGMTHYSATKYAMQGFFSSLRLELKLKNAGVSFTSMIYGPIASEKAIEVSNGIKTSISFFTVAGSMLGATDALVKGVAGRVYEVYYPVICIVLKYPLRLFPEFMESVLANIYEE